MMQVQQNNYPAIFSNICELVTASEFQKAQSDYMNLHKDKFLPQEENQLEHTTVHEGYIYLLE